MAQVRTVSGTKVYIGPSQAAEPANAAAYAALTWTEIGFVRSVPTYGDSASIISAAVVNEARVRKAKGARDSGDTEIVVYPDPADTGQQALVAAEATNLYYPFKVERPDKLTGGGTNGIDYFMGLVASKQLAGGENDTLATQTFSVALTTKVTSVAPT